MLKKWRIGTLFGFPVEVDLSLLILLGIVLLWFGGLVGLFVVGISFASVLLHELGHALVARRLGVAVSGIELNFFGGAAKMIELPRTASHEVAIAVAGPAVSVVLAAIGLGLGRAFQLPIVELIGWINVVIAGFNLLPALPMDGGRILRAMLTRKLDFVSATDAAVKVARVFAIGFAVTGLAIGAYQLVILAPFLWMMGTRERYLARQIAHRFAYDREGYTEHRGDVEVMPRGFTDHRMGRFAEGRFGGGPRDDERQFVIRQRNGRLVVEIR